MPIADYSKADPLLSRVEIIPQENQQFNLSITLSGNEAIMPALERKLNLQERKSEIGFLLVERAKGGKELIIRTSVTPPEHTPSGQISKSVQEKAARVVEAVYDFTRCRLGGLALAAEAVPLFGAAGATQLFAHPQAHAYSPQVLSGRMDMHEEKVLKGQPYSASVNIVPVVDRADKTNLVGHYSMEVIRKKFTPKKMDGSDILEGTASEMNGIVTDPRCLEGLRLIEVLPNFLDKRQAEQASEKLAQHIERTFNIYYRRPRLMLAGITTEPLDDDMRRKTGMVADILHNSKQPFVTTITLTGPDEALDSAERAMRHSFPSKVFKLERDGEVLQVMMCGDQHGDPAKLVAMVQNKTRCLLPMEINPCTAPCATVPEHFNPALETELWDEVPKKQRASTGTALAGYVGMQFPSYSLMLPERALHNKYVKSNARVVVNEPHRSEGDALTVAEHLKEGVEARMTRGQRPEFH